LKLETTCPACGAGPGVDYSMEIDDVELLEGLTASDLVLIGNLIRKNFIER